jgi:hypothetical protein
MDQDQQKSPIASENQKLYDSCLPLRNVNGPRGMDWPMLETGTRNSIMADNGSSTFGPGLANHAF